MIMEGMMVHYRSKTPSDPKSAAALTQIHPEESIVLTMHRKIHKCLDKPMAVAAKQAATFS